VAPSAILLPLMAFDEACRLVVEHLKREVPLAFWSVSRYEDGKQVYVYVRDDAYGHGIGGSVAWSDSFCQHMVTGAAPQIAPDVTSVPEYTATSVSRGLTVGAYAGVPIRGADGALYGTICGLDPRVASQDLVEQAPLLYLFASLLGQILQAEHLRAEAVDRPAGGGARGRLDGACGRLDGAGSVPKRAFPAAKRSSDDEGDYSAQREEKQQRDQLPEPDHDEEAEHEKAETADRDRAAPQLRALSRRLEGSARVPRDGVFQGGCFHRFGPVGQWFPLQFAQQASKPLYPDRRRYAQGKNRSAHVTKRSKEVAN